AGPGLINPNSDVRADALDAPLICIAAQPEVAARLHTQGIEHVEISQATEGVHRVSPNVALHSLPPKVTVASTVGAGDSHLAG
ncbi:PfkB family carbohydrate kinase, partial [Pseudomonas syringae pv. tagetis]|uniref:PfkB family carbohydrate kinase n=1 Tax=Pseudomonas syringae group genomosp. 7 TaxID=251699 RepID=UPI00377014CE